MRAAGRNLREIAPGLATLLIVEDVPEMVVAGSPGVDTVTTTAAGWSDRPGTTATTMTLVRASSRRPPPVRSPGDGRGRRRARHVDRPSALNAISFDLLDELATALEALDTDPTCRAIVLTGSGTRAFAAGADIKELATQSSASLTDGRRFEAGIGSPRSVSRSSPPFVASRSAAGVNSR